MSGVRSRRPNGPIRIAAGIVIATGVVQLGFGGLVAPVMGSLTVSLELSWWLQVSRMGLFALVFGAISVLLGLASVSVGVGLLGGRPWAWKASVALCVLYLPTGCGASSLVLFAVLMDPGCRAYFNRNLEGLDTKGRDPGI